MTWHYQLATKVDDSGDLEYQLVEVFTNEDESIWGYTEHTDILGWLAGEIDSEEEIQSSILDTLEMVARDVAARPVLDLDSLVTVEPDFVKELEDVFILGEG